MLRFAFVLSFCGAICGFAQEVRLLPADKVIFPTQTDGNSPSFSLKNRLHLFTSIGWPLKISESDGQFAVWESQVVDVTNLRGKAIWVEGAWADRDGIVFGWYHYEPSGLYQNSLLTVPKIGAVISYDGGRTIRDLGIILQSGDPLDDQAQNGYFTGGHGDFCVVMDREQKYFYLFFSNYGGPAESQGVAVARVAVDDRFNPAGKVYKYYNGEWIEPGIGGNVTPVFPAVRNWHFKDPDAFWGPAVHWNTYLNSFVMLLNRAKGGPGWNQEGVYITFTQDLSHPETWKVPTKVLDVSALSSPDTFYPQVMGLEVGANDTQAGRIARFYMNGTSIWEIEFSAGNGGFAPEPIGKFARHTGREQ